MTGTLRTTFPLSAVSRSQSLLTTGPTSTSLCPRCPHPPHSGTAPLSPVGLRSSGGARLLLWALATLSSHTWALKGALSAPTAPSTSWPQPQPQLRSSCPSEPCLLAAHCSESRGPHPPRFLASATALLALCRGLSDGLAPGEEPGPPLLTVTVSPGPPAHCQAYGRRSAISWWE